MSILTRTAPVLCLLGALTLEGCQSQAPRLQAEASLAQSRAAQAQYRRLHQRWTESMGSARYGLEAEHEAFLVQFPSDRRARLVAVQLALVHVERGDLASARRVLERARNTPKGSAHDFASVARAAILVREQKPAQALGVLEPLAGKIIDPHERYVFGEQITVASIEARHYRAAIEHLVAWLANSTGEDADSARAAATQLLERIPALAAEERLRFLDAETDNGGPLSPLAPARDWVRKTLRDRLVELAIRRRDPELSRRLIEGAPWFGQSDQLRELARLAASERVAARVAGRSIGLVLSPERGDSRRRSAAVSAGVMRALGLPESASEPGSVALLTAVEDGTAASMQGALRKLAGQGAAILIAGLEPVAAASAVSYAGHASIPVIVLSPPRGALNRYSFSLGADADRVESELVAALRARGVESPARIGPGGLPCRSAPGTTLPVDAWKRRGLAGVLITGDAECATDFLGELRGAGLEPVIAFGLECAEVAQRAQLGSAGLVAATGKYPGSIPDDDANDTARAPSWYEVLGRDAARLAAAALESFPASGADDQRAVAKLHAHARDALARVRVDLWSTDKTGFADQQVLPRHFITAPSAPDEGQRRVSRK